MELPKDPPGLRQWATALMLNCKGMGIELPCTSISNFKFDGPIPQSEVRIRTLEIIRFFCSRLDQLRIPVGRR